VSMDGLILILFLVALSCAVFGECVNPGLMFNDDVNGVSIFLAVVTLLTSCIVIILLLCF
jgi:hypothetical protein